MGCKNGVTDPVKPDNAATTNEAGNPDASTTPDEPTNSDTPVAATALQSQIDSAAAGGTVTFSATSVSAGAFVTITKPLTVNGNNIQGLTVIVSPAVASGVTLKNFKNATIKVGTTSSNRSARSSRAADDPAPVAAPAVAAADDDEDAIAFKKFGDEALPLFLEGCTIAKLEAEDDVALYLGTEDKKSVIDELCLKEGVEEFTFVEFDKADKPETTDNEATAKAEKSLVGKLSVEDDGIKEINLIGGTFNDIDFADDFDPLTNFELKVDKEFADQLDFEDETTKNEFLYFSKDVGVAEKTDATTIYKFRVPKDTLQMMKGCLTIAFMTENQATHIFNGQNTSWVDQSNIDVIHSVATFAQPIYAAMPAGLFCVDFETDGNFKTIYGSESAYVDYANAYARGYKFGYEREDVVALDYHRNYNKEAFVVEIDGSDAYIYVNMSAIKKDDVVLCTGEKVNGVPGYGEAGSKLSEINLNGYTPYIVLNSAAFESAYRIARPAPQLPTQDQFTSTGENPGFDEEAYNSALQQYQTEQTNWQNTQNAFLTDLNIKTKEGNFIQAEIPYGSAIKVASCGLDFYFSAFESAGSYPDVSNVQYSVIQTDPTLGRELLAQFDEENQGDPINPDDPPAPPTLYSLTYDEAVIIKVDTVPSNYTAGTDYTISGTTIALTADGFTKFLAGLNNAYAVAVWNIEGDYGFQPIATVDEYNACAALLSEDEYTVKANGKLVVLTAAGLQKMRGQVQPEPAPTPTPIPADGNDGE